MTTGASGTPLAILVDAIVRITFETLKARRRRSLDERFLAADCAPR
jgi:hypothetical protein